MKTTRSFPLHPFRPSPFLFLSYLSPPFAVSLEISLAGTSKNAGRKDVDVGVVEDDAGDGGLFYTDAVC